MRLVIHGKPGQVGQLKPWQAADHASWDRFRIGTDQKPFSRESTRIDANLEIRNEEKTMQQGIQYFEFRDADETLLEVSEEP